MNCEMIKTGSRRVVKIPENLVKPMKVKACNGKITLKLNGEVNYVVVK